MYLFVFYLRHLFVWLDLRKVLVIATRTYRTLLDVVNHEAYEPVYGILLLIMFLTQSWNLPPQIRVLVLQPFEITVSLSLLILKILQEISNVFVLKISKNSKACLFYLCGDWSWFSVFSSNLSDQFGFATDEELILELDHFVINRVKSTFCHFWNLSGWFNWMIIEFGSIPF